MDADSRAAGPRGAGPAATRQLDLAGCHNFRDLGGYPVAGGGHTRWRTLFRADGLARLTEEDLVVLGELGVVTVIDLRTPLEAEVRGRFPAGVDGVRLHHLPLTDTLPGEEDAPEWGAADFVTARYRGMLTEGAGSVAQALRLLAEPANLPAVFHCSVGKDRTGVLAAVILGVLGAHDADIVDDYALSAVPMTRILEGLRREYPDATEVVERYAPVILSVQPDAMAGFLAGVRQDHGTFDGLARALGVGAEAERLRTLLVERAG
ncbi:MAG TPA: tyrosine-protein phosphatase [Acidimicrobiales bacterium]|nr:tyrosine-protein phosphatase [Acidimicrobiales bacterium]